MLLFYSVCIICGRNATTTWWKCCPEHTTERGPEVVCDSCARKLHPEGLLEEE